uniref:ATP synthase F0 subunit 8 n=1 Tax=Echyridella menziesii TaxID=981778 RepID=A0A1X9JI87_9BIVA|nr:ATP synthase F0 subunit 8 [Echyridella menziesii]
MPQLSPMNWVLVCFLVVYLLVLLYVCLWWGGSGFYGISCVSER